MDDSRNRSAGGATGNPLKPSRRNRATIFVTAAVVIITPAAVIGLDHASGQGETGTGTGEGDKQS